MIRNINPFLLALLVILIIMLIMYAPLDSFLDKMIVNQFISESYITIIKMLTIFLIGFGMLKKLNQPALSGLSYKYEWQHKLLNIIPIYLILIGVSSFIGLDLSNIEFKNIFLLLTSCLMVGFAEEFVFRGFLQTYFITRFHKRKNGVFISILLPAAFFGMAHLLNLKVNNNIPQVLSQCIYAIMIGIFFGALLLKTNKLIPLAITHGCINFFFSVKNLPNLKQIEVSEINNSAQIISAIVTIIIFVPIFLSGLLIIRRIKNEEILIKLN